jgi:hypothetical protein
MPNPDNIRDHVFARHPLSAKQRAAETSDPRVKELFKDIAQCWLMLAERVEWLQTQFNNQYATKN